MTLALDNSMLRPRPVQIWFAVGVLSMSSVTAPAQDLSGTRVQLASVESSGQSARGLLGKPVLVSRSDVEASFARIRGGITANESLQLVQPLADPAFKAVLLTPRESTGRPVQIDMPAIPEAPVAAPSVELPNAAAPATAAPSSPPSTSSAALSAPVAGSNMPTTVKDPSRPVSPKVQALANPISRSRPSSPVVKSALASRAKVTTPSTHANYGAAEIAASRAFTRF